MQMVDGREAIVVPLAIGPAGWEVTTPEKALFWKTIFLDNSDIRFDLAGEARAHDAAFREEDHPRGQPQNAGQFATVPLSSLAKQKAGAPKKTALSALSKKGTAGPSATHGAAEGMLIGDLAKRISAPASSQQQVRDLDDLYVKARQDEPAFKQEIESVAQSFGGEAVFTPPEFAEPGTTLKSRKSAERKLSEPDIAGDPANIRDVLRATVKCDTTKMVRTAAANFILKHPEDVVRVKDRLVHPLGGYRDVLVNYKTASGLVAEVQFNSAHMMEAKFGEGHRLYEQLREMSSQPAGVPQDTIEDIRHRAQTLYDHAYTADGDGQWAGPGDD